MVEIEGRTAIIGIEWFRSLPVGGSSRGELRPCRRPRTGTPMRSPSLKGKHGPSHTSPGRFAFLRAQLPWSLRNQLE